MGELTTLQLETLKWRTHNFPDPDDRDVRAQLIGVMEELGELAHAVLKMQQGIRGEKQKHMDEAADSIGDLVIFLMGVCDALNLNLEGCVRDAWEEVKHRDWQANPNDGRTE